MINFDEIYERIKLATNTRTQLELADILEIKQSSISDAKRRNSIPSDWYLKLFEQFGLSPDWLKKACGPMYLRTEQGYLPVDPPEHSARATLSRFHVPDTKNVIVTVYSTQSATDGTEEMPVLGRLTIPQSFLSPGLLVIRSESASMEPHIRKGAFVGIDTAQRHVSSGDIYAVKFSYEGLLLKRAYADTQNSRFLLRSEDPAHPEVSLPFEGHAAHIVGRVAWVLQRV